MAKPRKRRIFQDLNRQLNMAAPLVAALPENFREPKGVEIWTGNVGGRPTTRAIIYFRSDVGCEFGVKTGGCLACRHFRSGTAGTRVDLPNMYVQQYKHAINEIGYTPGRLRIKS